MPTARHDNIEIEYEVVGNPEHPALLMVMGFTAQMVTWPDGLMEALAARGLFVIRFDNRDCGLSSKSEGPAPDTAAMILALMTKGPAGVTAPYTLSDMALDAFAVLDDLGIDAAHVVGASMGGMIAQTMAIDNPARVLSLTSIMSTTGSPDVGQGTPQAMEALISPMPDGREAILERGLSVSQIISGPLWNKERSEKLVALQYDRNFHPIGAAFQMAAILESGDRTKKLESVTTPTLVIHGREDPLIAPSGGEATAAAIPAAQLATINEMGHDLPMELWPRLSDLIAGHVNAVPVA